MLGAEEEGTFPGTHARGSTTLSGRLNQAPRGEPVERNLRALYLSLQVLFPGTGGVPGSVVFIWSVCTQGSLQSRRLAVSQKLL